MTDEPETLGGKDLEFRTQPDAEMVQRLLRVAENCPVSKILKGNINIITAVI
jgi:putative redox protein